MAKHRLRVCVGYKEDGTPIIKHISADGELALADKVVKTVLSSARQSEFMEIRQEEPEHAPTFRAYTEDFLEIYKVHRIKPTTRGFYRQILERYLFPEWGDAPISSITTGDIQRFLNANKHLSEKYLKDMLVLLRAILDSARRDKHIEDNPADDRRIQIPSTKKTVRQALDVQSVKSIAGDLRNLNLQDRRFMALLLYTGMRRGEVLGLRWEDMDFDTGIIHIERNITFPDGKNDPCIGTTKTRSGVRSVPIMPVLAEILEPEGMSGYVFGGEKPVTFSVVRRMNERIRRTIDLHGATPHVFRHSFATLLNDAGADIKTIQAIIGDSDFKTVADRYVHSRDDKARAAVENVGKLLVL